MPDEIVVNARLVLWEMGNYKRPASSPSVAGLHRFAGM